MTQNTAPPLYQQIKAKLKALIASGKLMQGALLPSETELAGQYQCSRLTVHRALREMAEEGFVERRRRAGTRVAAHGNIGMLIRMSRITDEISRRGFAYRYEHLETRSVVPPSSIAKLLEVPDGQEQVHIRCLHFADDRVFQFEDRWINSTAAPSIHSQNFERTSPSSWLLDNIPLSDLEHNIAATVPTPDVAAIMRLPDNVATLEIARRWTWKQRRISCAKLIYPGNLFRLSSESSE